MIVRVVNDTGGRYVTKHDNPRCIHGIDVVVECPLCHEEESINFNFE